MTPARKRREIAYRKSREREAFKEVERKRKAAIAYKEAQRLLQQSPACKETARKYRASAARKAKVKARTRTTLIDFSDMPESTTE